MNKITIVIPLAPGRKIEYPESIKNQSNSTCISESGLNPSKNRNKGIRKSKTEFIAFINGHTLLSEDWSKKVLEFFRKHPKIDIVGGPQLTLKSDNLFAKSTGYALSSVFGSANASKRYKQGKLNLNVNETLITSANLICRKKVFEKVIFDESMYPGEDPKFISDAKKAGFRIAYSPDIVVYNKRRDNFFSLAKQIYNYGMSRPKKEKLSETLKMPIFLIPSIFVIYLITLVWTLTISQLFLIPLIAYLISDAIFSLIESIKNKSVLSFFLLILIFPTIHLSYGIGFIIGLIRNLV